MYKYILIIMVLSGCSGLSKELRSDYESTEPKSMSETISDLDYQLSAAGVSRKEKIEYINLLKKNEKKRLELSQSQKKLFAMLLDNKNKYSMHQIREVCSKIESLGHKKVKLRMEGLYALRILVREQAIEEELRYYDYYENWLF